MHRSQGFTLLEVMIVVTIIAFLATLSFQNLLHSLDRGRQSSTLADLRAVASALERFAIEHQSYPVVPNMSALRPDLEPRYIKQLPLTDGWHHQLVYAVDKRGTTYTLSSPGKDGEFQEASPAAAAEDFAADIVCVDGVFLQRSTDEETQPSQDPAVTSD